MHRYLGLLWNEADGHSAALAQRLARQLRPRNPRWTLAIEQPGMLVLHCAPAGSTATIYSLQDGGVVLGRLFEQRDSSKEVVFTPEDAQRILQSGGRELIERYWGRYVALLKPQPGDHRILRDPSGAIQCYYRRLGELTLVFSHIEDCLGHAELPLQVNLDHVAAFLRFNRLVTRHTGFKEILAVHAGECVRLTSDGIESQFLWKPQRFCEEGPLDDPIAARCAVREAVENSVHAWGRCYDRILLELSGGLDSSIVATCLRTLGKRPEVICSNLYMNTPEGDERRYARAAAAHSGFELIEIPLHADEQRPSPVDLAFHGKGQVSPIETQFVPATEVPRATLVKQRRLQALFTGQGGDHFFLQRREPAIVHEYLFHKGWRPQVFRVLLDTAHLCNMTVPALIRQLLASGNAIDEETLYAFGVPPSFMSRELASIPLSSISHPWLEDSGELPALKRWQLFDLIDSQNCYKYRCRVAEMTHPLISQPVIECALRIPGYVLASHGLPRSLYREAFADALPPQIVNRHSKGNATGHYHRLVLTNLAFIREFLLDGALVQHGLLDAALLEAELREDELIRSGRIDPILKSLLAEAWLREASVSASQAA